MLKKAEKSNIKVKKFEFKNNALIDEFISSYENFQAFKKFRGVPSNILYELFEQNKLNIYTAYKERESEDKLGMLATINHGVVSSYIIGFTNEAGRESNVNYLLLWRSILDAKKNELYLV